MMEKGAAKSSLPPFHMPVTTYTVSQSVIKITGLLFK